MDKQKLNNAAKAAGYELSWTVCGSYQLQHPCLSGCLWYPLNDDGTAFRLMVDAGISLMVMPRFVLAECFPRSARAYYHAHNNDKQAATRQAIFDCAAAIGESMTEGKDNG